MKAPSIHRSTAVVAVYIALLSCAVLYVTFDGNNPFWRLDQALARIVLLVVPALGTAMIYPILEYFTIPPASADRELPEDSDS